MSEEIEISSLIQTKLHRPRLTGELIERPHLLERLDARRRPLTLVAAPAGYGKTTLVNQWLDQAPYPAACQGNCPMTVALNGAANNSPRGA
jgi:LuxR family maltose regulon positive regulatory protein